MNDRPHHTFRMHAFVPETSWSLDGDALVREGDGAPLRLPLAEAIEMRLVFDPSRIVRDRYRCDIRFRRGQRVKLINKSYQGIADFEVVPAKLVVIAAMIPTAIAYARKNRPRAFDPSAIPRDLLPEIAPAR